MPKLIFLSRLAFICNICYLLGFLIRVDVIKSDNFLSPTILLLGYLAGIFLNLTVNLVYTWKLLQKRTLEDHPKWLALVNLLFLIVQIADLAI